MAGITINDYRNAEVMEDVHDAIDSFQSASHSLQAKSRITPAEAAALQDLQARVESTVKAAIAAVDAMRLTGVAAEGREAQKEKLKKALKQSRVETAETLRYAANPGNVYSYRLSGAIFGNGPRSRLIASFLGTRERALVFSRLNTTAAGMSRPLEQLKIVRNLHIGGEDFENYRKALGLNTYDFQGVLRHCKALNRFSVEWVLGNTPRVQAALQELCNRPKLVISLCDDYVFRSFAQGNPTCTSLTLQSDRGISYSWSSLTPNGLRTLLAGCKALESLTIHFHCSNEMMQVLAEFPQLKSIEITDCDALTEDTREKMKKGCTSLEHFTCTDPKALDSETFWDFIDIPTMKFLDLGLCHISKATFRALAEMQETGSERADITVRCDGTGLIVNPSGKAPGSIQEIPWSANRLNPEKLGENRRA